MMDLRFTIPYWVLVNETSDESLQFTLDLDNCVELV